MSAFYLLVPGLLLCPALHAQLTTSPPGTNATTVSTIVGSGVTISNITVNCDSGAYGYFTSNSTPVQLPSGVIMTTGKHSIAVGPNNSPVAGYSVGSSSADPQLTALEPTATNDLCRIEFDCVPQNNTLQFSFVFGSEEYIENVGPDPNDVFGVFLSGPNPAGGFYNNQNIAILPNTTPVSIDNVNSSSNNSFYINNNGNQLVQYDGLTVKITPVINVAPTSSYHLKFAIADAGPPFDDSGLFLEGGSLSSPVSIAEEGVLQGLRIYPNPAEEKLNFVFPYPAEGEAKIVLRNLLGQDVMKMERRVAPGESVVMDVEKLAAGVYVGEIVLGEVRATRRIVVR